MSTSSNNSRIQRRCFNQGFMERLEAQRAATIGQTELPSVLINALNNLDRANNDEFNRTFDALVLCRQRFLLNPVQNERYNRYYNQILVSTLNRMD